MNGRGRDQDLLSLILVFAPGAPARVQRQWDGSDPEQTPLKVADHRRDLPADAPWEHPV